MKVKELSSLYKKDQPLYEWLVLQTISGLSFHEQLEEVIDDEYEQNKKEAFAIYKNHSMYRPYLFEAHPITSKIRMQKLLALYLYHEKQCEGAGREKLMELVVRGYKRIYDYVMNHEIFSPASFLMYYNAQKENIPERVQGALIGIALFVGYPDKEVQVKPHDAVLRTFLYNVQALSAPFKEKDTGYEEAKKGEEMNAVKKYQRTFGAKFGKEDLLDFILNKMETKAVEQLTEKEKKDLMDNGNFEPLYRKSMYRYWKPLTAVLRINEIDELSYGMIPITREDLLDIHTIFNDAVEKGKIQEGDYEFFVTASFALLMMTRHYQKLGEEFLTLFEKNSFAEEIKRETTWKEEKQVLIQREKEMKQELAEEKERNLLQQKRIEELERQIKQIKQEEIEEKELKMEVVALRDFLFSLDQEPEHILPEDDNQAAVDFLMKKKIAVIGGHQNWHTKLKEALPHIRTVRPDEKNIDYSFIQNMDIVCIETSYNNHTIYEKAMGNLSKKTDLLVYLNQKKNISQILKYWHQEYQSKQEKRE